MRRRELLVILGGAAALPMVARAQRDLPVVAVLVPGPAKNAENRMVAIRQGMREAGLTEGINFTFASRYADGVFDRLPELKGLDAVPAIAGRSPTYIMRQLYEFQHGSRSGGESALMKQTVDKLSQEDMIAIAAYVASLDP